MCSYISEPVILFGHSSGGIVALEYALRHSSALAGLALYEPPVAISEPLGGAALVRAKQALAQGKLEKAASIHLRNIVHISLPLFCVARLSPFWKTITASVREQIADTEAIEALGVGVERYSTIRIPVLMIGGTRSPAHLQTRLKSLSTVVPNSQTLFLKGLSHFAGEKEQRMIASRLREFSDKVFKNSGDGIGVHVRLTDSPGLE